MACNGTYLGECCEPAQCEPQIINLQAINRFYVPFTYGNERCVLPESGYRKLRSTTIYAATYGEESAGECGVGTFTTTRILEYEVTACGVETQVRDELVGEARTQCTSGLTLPESELVSSRVSDDIQTTVTRNFEVGGRSLLITQITELLNGFSVQDFINELEEAMSFHIQNSKGLNTSIGWNCDGTGFTVAQSSAGSGVQRSGNAVHSFVAGLGLGPYYGIDVRRQYRVLRPLRPYRITTTANAPGCFETRVEDVLKEQPPGVDEYDCIGLNPALNERITIAALV